MLTKKELCVQLEECIAFHEEWANKPELWKNGDTGCETKKELDSRLHTLRIALALEDPWFFCMNFGYTQDEHDTVNPYKPFIGRQEKAIDYGYLQEITQVWQEEKLIITPKSRHLRITWLAGHLYLWDAIKYHARRNGMQTKNEDAADMLISRVEITAKHLPREMLPYNKNLRTFCRFRVPQKESLIWGLPQGPDVARSYTFSHYFIDEAWMQDDLEATYSAVRPTLDSGGSVWMVCSAPRNLNRSAIFFGNLSDDLYGVDNVPENIYQQKIDKYKIIDVRRNRNGFVRALVHYGMVPHRWLAVKEGGEQVRKWVTTEEWKKEASKGMSLLAWNREQEISFELGMGDKKFEPELLRKLKDTQVESPLKQGRLIVNPKAGTAEFIEGEGPLSIWKWPRQQKKTPWGEITQYRGEYVGGVDVGAGISMSGDPSACYIADTMTKKIVAKYKGHKRPRIFAQELWKLGMFYNEAFFVIEANTYGLGTLDALWEGTREYDDYGRLLFEMKPYNNIYFRTILDEARDRVTRKLGFYISGLPGSKLKELIVEEYAQVLRDGVFKVPDLELVQEMANYIAFEDGTLGAVRGHDDLVMSAVYTWQGIKERPYIPQVQQELVTSDEYS